jgi:hypothetical protein
LGSVKPSASRSAEVLASGVRAASGVAVAVAAGVALAVGAGFGTGRLLAPPHPLP